MPTRARWFRSRSCRSTATWPDVDLDTYSLGAHLAANAAVGVPYSAEMIANAHADTWAQATPDADTSTFLERYPKALFEDFDGDPSRVTEMDALVAYLQMLGTLVDFSAYDASANYR